MDACGTEPAIARLKARQQPWVGNDGDSVTDFVPKLKRSREKFKRDHPLPPLPSGAADAARKRQHAALPASPGQPPADSSARQPPYVELMVDSPDGDDVQACPVDPALPLRDTLLCHELLPGLHLYLDGERLNTSKSASDLGLTHGTVLQACRPQTGGGYEEEEALLDVDLDAEREINAEREGDEARTSDASGTGGRLAQQQLALPASPFAFLKPVNEGACQHVVVPTTSYMPPFRGTKVPYTPPGTTTTAKIDIEPQPNTQHAYGSITLASPWMGGGKTTAKRDYQKDLIRESPSMRSLDIDCNRIYSVSNAVNLKKTADELRGEGLAHVTAAGYLDEKQTVDLSEHQMVGCSFESLFKLDSQSFGLVTMDEVSALALKIGGGTMPHFECVDVLRALLNKPGTRVLALDAAAGFTMSPTEPSTATQDFFKLVAPHRKVLSVALDPANMPSHLTRKLRLYYGAENGQTDAWMSRIVDSIKAWHADKSRRFLVAVGTKTFGTTVAALLQEYGVPFRFYKGDSDEKIRFRDLADPEQYMASLACAICTTVMNRGVDMPQSLTFDKVYVEMDRIGCDFGDQFQTMLRPRHVLNQTVEVLLVGCLSQPARQLLESQGKRKPVMRPTYDQKLLEQKQRRGYALRAAERAASVSRMANDAAPATDALLRVMAHQTLNRNMQEVDPLYVFERYASFYGFPIVNAASASEAEQQAPQRHRLELDEDQVFADLKDALPKWTHIVELVRERGTDGFFKDKCWGLAADETRKSNQSTAREQWLVKAYHALKHISELPASGEEDEDAGGASVTADNDEDEGGEEGLAAAGDENEEHGDDAGGASVAAENDEDEGGEEGLAAAGDENEEHGEEGTDKCNDDPAAVLLYSWLGNGSPATDLTPALQLQAHCLLFTPKEQMLRDEADRIESQQSRKPSKHVHCELSIGMTMVQVERFGRLLLRDNFSHVKQVFELAGGVLNSAHRDLVAAANREISKRMTPADESLIKDLKEIKAALDVSGKGNTLIELLKALARALGLKLTVKYAQVKQPDGKRPRLVRNDPGVSFERVLPGVAEKWLVWCPSLGAKVRVADWQQHHAEQQQLRAEDTWAGADDNGDLFNGPFRVEEDDPAVGGNPNVRVELIPDNALQSQLSALQAQYDAGRWMDAASPATRLTWSGPQREMYRRHLSTTNSLNAAKAIDREADEASGLRKLHVAYGKNSLDLGRRTATAPSMQSCPSALRHALCCALYHDIDIVSCHPTLMLGVVRKMVQAGALKRSDALDKLVEYAELDAAGKPAGRMPILLRVADYFGIDRGVAKDVCKTLVLRVLNGGQVEAWCRDMGIAMPEGEPQRDLEALEEVARIVREAFFAMMERDNPPGSLETLRNRTWKYMQDKHERQVQDARRKGEAPPQRPSIAKRDRTMFSHCIFNLEDTILDCIDTKLRELGWGVDSLIYDGVGQKALHRSLSPNLYTHTYTISLMLCAACVWGAHSCTFGIATIAEMPT